MKPVVLAVKVGRARPFGVTLLLSVATFGVYWFYWAYRTHDEVYRQFELAREGREEGVAWIIFGSFLPFLRYIYYHRFVANIHDVRQRMGFPRSLTPGRYLGLSLTGGAAFTALALVGLVLIGSSVEPDRDGELQVTDEALLGVAFVVLGVAVVQWLVLKAVAMRLLQSDLNGLWEAYDARAAVVRAGLSRAPAAPPAATPGAARAPRGPAGPA